jgi:hypothetical protein
VFRSKGFNLFPLCRGICENVFHLFTLTFHKLPNSFGILQPLSNKTNRNTTTVPAERSSPKRPIVFNNCQVTNNKKKEYSCKRQTKGIIYLANALNNIQCNQTDVSYWEGYLRKIPVFRLGKLFVSRLVFFANTPPKHDIYVQNIYPKDKNKKPHGITTDYCKNDYYQFPIYKKGIYLLYRSLISE